MSFSTVPGTYTDMYQLTMAQVYFNNQRQHEPAVFDYFFRKLPFGGGYAISAGLSDLLTMLEQLCFLPRDLDYLHTQGFHPDFLHYLSQFRFQGNLDAVQEGDIVFPTMPIIRIKANLIEAQIIETLLLNVINFQTLIASKARRMRLASEKRNLFEFGLRRAQGLGGYHASRAAMIGGFNATSNVLTGEEYQSPIAGTMAHSFVQSHATELEAFHSFARVWPDRCVLLVDTYNTLKSGLPNAIQVARALQQQGFKLQGIRIDSGDLAYLSIQARKMLDFAGFPNVKITASNQLDEHVIKSLLEQGAPIDSFGVGTQLVTGHPDGALDGVYKLAKIKDKPCIKLSDASSKTTLPDNKQVWRIIDANQQFLGADVIGLTTENKPRCMHHPFEPGRSLDLTKYPMEPLLYPMMIDGKRLKPPQSLTEIAEWSQARLSRLPQEYQRFSNPHHYKVGLSTQLKKLRDALIEKYKGCHDEGSTI